MFKYYFQQQKKELVFRSVLERGFLVFDVHFYNFLRFSFYSRTSLYRFKQKVLNINLIQQENTIELGSTKVCPNAKMYFVLYFFTKN